MPLPWKKARVSRISRIMADLHPSKPCSSMVVETGFPTSLVDLFLKNCDRLKKPIKKKKNHHHHHHHHHLGQVIEELVISDPVPLSSSRDLNAAEPVYVDNKFKRQHNFDGHRNIIDGFEILGGEDPNHFSNQSERGCGDSGGVVDVDTGSNKDERCVLFAILKMLVVVILALSTKKFALGVTMSAVFLLFLEYIGKHLLCFLQPCSRVALQPLIQLPFVIVHMRDLWVCNFIRLESCWWVHEEAREGLIIEGEDANAGAGTLAAAAADDLLDSLELNSSGQEIQVAEARFDTVARAEAYQYQTAVDLLAWGRRWGRLDMLIDKDESEDLIHGEEHHHSHKIRRTIIKKLVPKKLRAMKKARKWKVREEDVSSEVSSHNGEDKLCGIEETEEQDNFDEKENLALWQKVEEEKEGKCEEEKEEEIENKTSDSSMELQTNSEMIVFEKVGNRGSPLLLLIILAGLVGGRILALGLTVVSCLIIQLAWRGSRGCVNKTSASMSS